MKTRFSFFCYLIYFPFLHFFRKLELLVLMYNYICFTNICKALFKIMHKDIGQVHVAASFFFPVGRSGGGGSITNLIP